MQSPRLEKYELSIDGQKQRARVAPYIDKHGFHLQNDPLLSHHFEIRLRPDALSKILGEHHGRSVAVDVVESDLGFVRENIGYSSADLGAASRPITSLKFRVTRVIGATVFRFEGTAGPVNPRTVNRPDYIQSLGKLQGFNYSVQFEIDDQSLPQYFFDAVALGAINEYVRSMTSVFVQVRRLLGGILGL